MSKKSSKSSSYRSPNRSEKILAVIGLLVVISMIVSALALSFDTVPIVEPTATFGFIFTSTPQPSPTASPTASGPASPTPGQAPAPGSP